MLRRFSEITKDLQTFHFTDARIIRGVSDSRVAMEMREVRSSWSVEVAESNRGIMPAGWPNGRIAALKVVPWASSRREAREDVHESRVEYEAGAAITTGS